MAPTPRRGGGTTPRMRACVTRNSIPASTSSITARAAISNTIGCSRPAPTPRRYAWRSRASIAWQSTGRVHCSCARRDTRCACWCWFFFWFRSWDGGGNVYLTGETASSDFPVSGGAAQGVSGGGSDAFVAKFDSAGALVYVTYLGGAGSDRGTALAGDGGGATYVTGTTESLDFPLQNAEQPSYGGIADAFVATLSADGASLVYSTYLGGNAQESANAIVVDGSGAAYVAGGTLSPNFPVSAGAVQSSFQSIANDQGVIEADGYIAKLSADGASLVYSTYLGGSDGECDVEHRLAV